jgi:hypothetical protein
MGFLPDQDGLVFAGFDTKQASFTALGLVNTGMAVKPEIYFSENMLRADIHTCPTGFATAGIQDDARWREGV